MLVKICEDYFNLEEIRHIYTTNFVDGISTINIELNNNDIYEFEFKEEIYGCNIDTYLERIINGVNMMTRNLNVGTKRKDWEYWEK